MHESQLLLTLTGSLAAALVLGFVTHRIGLSPIVGYLIAGFVVGPYTPGFVADRALAGEFAEIGVILLMFGVGLHFHIKDLFAVRYIAIIGAFSQSAVATLLGAILGTTLGWSVSGSVVFGIALSVASTVVLTRVLADNQALRLPTGRIAIGWLIVEDLFTVVVLVLLPVVFAPTAGANGGIAAALLLAIVKIAILVFFAFFIGGRVIPRILSVVAQTHSRELFTLTVLVLALGIAVGSAMMFGASMALGAFLAGMVVGQSEFSLRAASEALPMRDAFAVLFFVSVGMLFEPAQLMRAPLLLLFTLVIVLVGKPLAAFAIVSVMGYGSKVALGVSAALAQMGEFSLIVATVGDQLGILPSGATNAIVAGSIVSITLNPFLYRYTERVEAALQRRPGLWRVLNRRTTPSDLLVGSEAEPHRYHTVIVGYGPIGQTLARLLRDGGVEPVIVEINIETVRRLQREGYRAVYGDAARREVLEGAGVQDAAGLVISGPTSEQAAEIIRLARSMNSNLHVLSRTTFLKDALAMHEAGATEVFSGEGEVALAMTESILRQLGATPEQMDRERERVRREVFRRER